MKPRVSPHLFFLLSLLVRNLCLMQASETSETINAINFFRLLPTRQADAIHEIPQKTSNNAKKNKVNHKQPILFKESLSHLRVSFKRWNADWCLDKGREVFVRFFVKLCRNCNLTGSQVSSCLARARKSRGDREGSIA